VAVLERHRDMVLETVRGIPGLTAAVPQATYLVWIDCRGSGLADPQAACEAAGLGPSDGRDFGFPGFIRLNTACPTARLAEALRRLERAFQTGTGA
jgi:cystathionine beta-lyase